VEEAPAGAFVSEPESGFTPAVSMFVHCDSDQEIDRLYKVLSEGGRILMQLDKYDCFGKFCCITDKYGVSWRMILAPSTT
jgi:predicted 3-demethylubiquinone-9 3-methyltransferase (glyoxalase superfamily)